MTPLALESGWAIAGGLIPIIGLAGIGLILWRAIRDNPSEAAEEEERKGVRDADDGEGHP